MKMRIFKTLKIIANSDNNKTFQRPTAPFILLLMHIEIYEGISLAQHNQYKS